MNRRDFMKTAAAVCVLPSITTLASERPVRIYVDGEGETYIAHSLDELIAWLTGYLGVEERWLPRRDDWREMDAAEADATPIRDEDGGPTVSLMSLITDHLCSGGEVPTQMATTYC